MKWMFGAVMVSVAALAACSSGKSTNDGSGGSGGGSENPVTSTSTGVTSTSSSTTSTGTTTSSSSTGQGGAGGGTASACDNTGNCQTCGSCAQKAGGPCNQAAVDFQMLPNWMVFYQCITPCTMKPTPQEQQACYMTCCTANQTECTAYGKFAQCVTCDACYSDCNGAAAMCPP